MHACENNHPKCALLLLEEAEKFSSNSDVKYYSDESDGHVTALMLAAASGCEEAVLALKDKEIGLQDSQGYTALMHACEKNHPKCAQLLMEEIAKTNKTRQTALMLCAKSGCDETIAMLKKRELNT